MRFDDLLQVSLRQVLRQRRRNLGAALAIAIGTAGLIVVITMGQNVKENLNKDLELLGGATRIKVGFFEDKKYPVSRLPWFRDATVNAIRSLPGVTGASLVAVRGGIVLYSRNNQPIHLQLLAGVDEYYWEINSFSATQGDFFGAEEVKQRQKVCVLGEGLAEKLFGHKNVIGHLLNIENNYYRVAGLLGGLGISDRTDWVFIPLTTAEDRVRGRWFPNYLYVRCHTWDDVERVASAIPTVVRAKQSAEGLKVMVADEYLKRVKKMAWWIEFLVYLAIIATLVLGGFGIWNIMMANVGSRTREIGLKKAIGAEDRDIQYQFLTEALCLSLGASIAGIVVGRLAVEALASILGCRPPEDLFFICVGLGLLFSVILGVGAGIVPSIRASRMEVVYAVRHE